jgi:hypothetical protein
LWRYKNYADFAGVHETLGKDATHQQFTNKVASCVNKRESQVCLSFTFWGEPPVRSANHIYEMRSYALKPGTLIEWGNNWYVFYTLKI